MPARFAWLQSLIYEGKALDDVYFVRQDGSPWTALTKMTINNYMRGAVMDIHDAKPFHQLFRARG
jgi:hypothetical protein